MKRQDLNGYRTPEEVVRRWDLSKIELNTEDIEKIKQDIVCDTSLSITSEAPVQNKVITSAINNKVTKVAGKGLSDENYTTLEKTKLDSVETDAEKNIIEAIKVNGTQLTPDSSRAVDITVPDSYTWLSKTNCTSSNNIAIPLTAKEIMVYVIMPSNAYMILGYVPYEIISSNTSIDLMNYVVNYTSTYYASITFSNSSNSKYLYVWQAQKNGSDVVSTTTLYVGYR